MSLPDVCGFLLAFNGKLAILWRYFLKHLAYGKVGKLILQMDGILWALNLSFQELWFEARSDGLITVIQNKQFNYESSNSSYAKYTLQSLPVVDSFNQEDSFVKRNVLKKVAMRLVPGTLPTHPPAQTILHINSVFQDRGSKQVSCNMFPKCAPWD